MAKIPLYRNRIIYLKMQYNRYTFKESVVGTCIELRNGTSNILSFDIFFIKKYVI